MAEGKEGKYRLILSGYGDGPTNMAIDEAILLAASQAPAPPTIRFYGWSPNALSLGYAQNLRAEIDLERCQAWGIDLVRRPTGGRAVFHDQELTYSVVAPEAAFPASPSILATYREISRALIAGLACLGIEAQMIPERPRLRERETRSVSPAACFAAPSAYEVAVEGKKIVGSAQKRLKGYLLQQGSILISLDREKLFALFQPHAFERGSGGARFRPATAKCGGEIEKCPGGRQFSISHFPFPRERSDGSPAPWGERMTSIREVLGREASFEEVASAMRQGFVEAWEAEMEEGELSESEQELAAELRQVKYSRPEWNLRR